MSRHPLTPAGFRRLAEELKHLKEFERGKIVRDIEEARAHGDISENSEYEDAKERQSHCEGRIVYLEGVCAGAEIIDVAKLPQNGRVVFGVTVHLKDAESDEQRTWRIVGENEADIENHRISFKSPVGKALIGKSEGDEVSVPAPGGVRRWEIMQVEYIGD